MVRILKISSLQGVSYCNSVSPLRKNAACSFQFEFSDKIHQLLFSPCPHYTLILFWALLLRHSPRNERKSGHKLKKLSTNWCGKWILAFFRSWGSENGLISQFIGGCKGSRYSGFSTTNFFWLCEVLGGNSPFFH
jgi:hypothetical protein